MLVMTIALGLIVGLVLGLTGAGGSIIAVPLLMWALDWSLLQAAPVALIAVAVSASFGTLYAWDVAVIRYRAALLMGAAGLITAPLGLLAAERLPLTLLTLTFSLVLLVVAARMWHQSRHAPEETRVVRASLRGADDLTGDAICKLNPATGRFVWTQRCAATVGACGAATGFLAGLLGVGGGFVIVPGLRSISDVSIHAAIATSLMAIALISSVTVVIAMLLGRELPWTVALPFALGALGGMLAGRQLAQHIAGPKLQKMFSVLLGLVALAMLARSTGWI
jgi:uncharacterized protein